MYVKWILMIVIIDYGIGNLGSILNMIKRLGISVKISSNIVDIENAEKLILSGVGSFDAGIRNLQKLDLVNILNEKVLKKRTPILGLCLGMQLMTEKSEEGKLVGLGWIKGKTVKFKFDNLNLKVPHMGWNTIKIVKGNSLFKNLENARFYFVHSYYVKCEKSENVLTTTNYGIEFCSALNKENIYGVQFHPEKSHKFGMQLFENFSKL